MELAQSIDPVVVSITPFLPLIYQIDSCSSQPQTHFQSGSLNNSNAGFCFQSIRPYQHYYVLSLQITSQNTFSSARVHEAYRGDLCAKKRTNQGHLGASFSETDSFNFSSGHDL